MKLFHKHISHFIGSPPPTVFSFHQIPLKPEKNKNVVWFDKGFLGNHSCPCVCPPWNKL